MFGFLRAIFLLLAMEIISQILKVKGLLVYEDGWGEREDCEMGLVSPVSKNIATVWSIMDDKYPLRALPTTQRLR